MTIGDCKQIGVGLGPAQPPPLRAISGYAPVMADVCLFKLKVVISQA